MPEFTQQDVDTLVADLRRAGISEQDIRELWIPEDFIIPKENTMSDPNRKAERLAAREAAEREYNDYILTLTSEGAEFQEFPKMARLNREIMVTEKIDGTNAAVGVIRAADGELLVYAQSRTRILTPESDNFGFARWVQEHEQELAEALGEGLHFGEWWGRGIQRGYDLPGKRFSLFNTYRWILHEGQKYQFGGYEIIHSGPDMLHPSIDELQKLGIEIDVVPLLYRGPLVANAGFLNSEGRLEELRDIITEAVNGAYTPQTDVEPVLDRARESSRLRFMPHLQAEMLRRHGSFAAPGFMKPEGIVTFHLAARIGLKMTLEHDEQHKGEVR